MLKNRPTETYKVYMKDTEMTISKWMKNYKPTCRGEKGISTANLDYFNTR